MVNPWCPQGLKRLHNSPFPVVSYVTALTLPLSVSCHFLPIPLSSPPPCTHSWLLTLCLWPWPLELHAASCSPPISWAACVCLEDFCCSRKVLLLHDFRINWRAVRSISSWVKRQQGKGAHSLVLRPFGWRKLRGQCCMKQTSQLRLRRMISCNLSCSAS